MSTIKTGLADFYGGKSVLPSWKFLVYFAVNTTQDSALKHYLNKLKYYHIVDVSIPMYEFEVESTKYGSVAKNFPKINHNGFAVKITMEDDNEGNILTLIHLLQKTVVRDSGIYRPLPEHNIGNIVVDLYNLNSQCVGQWICKNIFYLGSQEIGLSYTNNDVLKYNITFGCDVILFKNEMSFNR